MNLFCLSQGWGYIASMLEYYEQLILPYLSSLQYTTLQYKLVQTCSILCFKRLRLGLGLHTTLPQQHFNTLHYIINLFQTLIQASSVRVRVTLPHCTILPSLYYQIYLYYPLGYTCSIPLQVSIHIYYTTLQFALHYTTNIFRLFVKVFRPSIRLYLPCSTASVYSQGHYLIGQLTFAAIICLIAADSNFTCGR